MKTSPKIVRMSHMSDIALACPQGRQFEKKTGGGQNSSLWIVILYSSFDLK